MAFETLTACAVAGIIALALTAALARWPEKIAIWDVPNARSSHSAPKPRTGGIALFAAWCAGTFAAWGMGAPVDRRLLAGAAAFFLLGLADDRWRLSERRRLAVQLVVAACLAAAGARLGAGALPGLVAGPSLPVVSGVMTVLWICGFVNLFNFMDGIDGLAAAHAVAAGAFLGVLTSQLPPFVAAAAAAGFLLFNASPSRIFMGDSGSYFLGSVLAVSAVLGAERAPFPALVLPFGAFVADASVTLVRRMLAGEIWYKAHRSHFYQRLVASGWSHSRVTRLYTALSLAFGLAAAAYVRAGALARIGILAGGAGGIAAVFVWISRREGRRAVDGSNPIQGG